MKPFLLLLLLAAGAAALWVAQRTDDPTYAPPAEPEVVHTVIPEVLGSQPAPGEVVRAFRVEGMCCTGCPVKLHELLMDVDGVRVAAVSFDAGTATVIARADVSSQQLESLLTFDKYRATLEPATP